MADKDYVDARIEATRAQNEAAFAGLRADTATLSADVRALGATLDADIRSLSDAMATDRRNMASLRDIQGMKLNIWGATGVLAALLVGLLAYGGDRFDGGVQVSSVSVEQAIEAKRQAAENRDEISGLRSELRTLTDLLRERVNQ